ncbi:FTR1 family iron permease [Prosthecomicrobium sp. N25]|uniref:FTR1 family iron permease n=1 Tax=Prosthecomicrobium sp. N25 TaxID=3129254 RepID=UPI003FCC4E38
MIASLSAWLRRSGAQDRVGVLYAGAALALVASVGSAAVFEVFLNGAHDDRLEAAVLVLAAGLLLYTSGWLFLRQDPRRWTEELRRAADGALAAGTTATLGALAFLAVFREGGETILFLHAMAREAGGWTLGILAGLAGAIVLLAALFGAMQWLAVRLPLRPVFLVTSAFLFLMGLRFVGAAIQELQEQALLPVDDAPVPGWFLEAGFNGTWEAVAAQAGLGLAALATTLALMGRRRGRDAVAAAE